MNSSAAPSCLAAVFLTASLPAATLAQTPIYDFQAVTTLAQEALAGTNIPRPVPGFEVLLMRDGQVVYRKNFGQWQRDQIAASDSATKTISGAVIMSLTESSARPFTLDTPLSTLLPAMTGEKQAITLRQAFSHQAGFGGFGNVLANPSLTLQQAAATIISFSLVHDVGLEFSYGGASMHVAGAAAEIAGNASWNDLFLQRIAAPLGLTATRYTLTTPANPRIAGGCQSTAAEFARVMEMLRRGGLHNNTRVLQQASVDALFTRQPPLNITVINSPVGLPTPQQQSDYGIGVWLDERTPTGTLTGALAAGARGFSAWIDFDDQMVGAFSTDQALSGEVLPWVRRVRAAAQEAVRLGPVCPADTGSQGGSRGADGVLDNNDFVVFTNLFFATDPRADLGREGGEQGPDGRYDNNDFITFINSFFAGCS